MLGATSDTFRILAYSELCLVKYIETYSSIFSIIKTYSGMPSHYQGIFTLYSGIFRILCNPDIFTIFILRTGGMFKIV